MSHGAIGSTASSASTITYSIQQYEDEYKFSVQCWFDAKKAQVTLKTNERGASAAAAARRGVLDIKAAKNFKDKDIPAIQRNIASGGVIVLPKGADLSQQPVVDKEQGGLVIVVKKLAAAA
eukprot:3342022-Prymnesium_polylepis.1